MRKQNQYSISVLHGHATEETPEQQQSTSVLVVRGEKRVMALLPLLIRLSEQCAQPGTMQDLAYFLQKPGLLKRVPYLCLVTRQPAGSPETLFPGDLLGSVLLLEYRVLRLGTRSFATNDRSGRGSLLALPQDRMRVASAASEALLARGANVVMISYVSEDETASAQQSPAFSREAHLRGSVTWSMRKRLYPAYLLLRHTLNETLATLGQKTRSNMRYYRRRAEKELGATFVPEVLVTERELIRYNGECMYPVSKATVRWRLRVQPVLEDSFLMGLKDARGRWLSILAGRRFGETSEILWQMNRDGYPMHSLGTAMRSYCMEHELLRGAKRLQVEGGTFHSIHHSFVREEITDFVVVRARSKHLVSKLVMRYVPPDNNLAEMFKNGSLEWHTA